MALPSTGIHVFCSLAGASGVGAQPLPVTSVSSSALHWGEDVAPGAATTRGAIDPSTAGGQAIASIYAYADAWIAVGLAPDASQASGVGNTAREILKAGERLSIGLPAGFKVACAAV